MSHIKIKTSPWGITRILSIIAITLVTLSLLGQISIYFLPDFPLRDGLAGEFNVKNEGNFPTLFSALLLFFASYLLGNVAINRKADNQSDQQQWLFLCFIFAYLGIDELLSLHDRAVAPLRNLGFKGFLYHAWIVPAAVIVLILLIVFFRFLLGLPRHTKRMFLIGGFLYVFGALGLEAVQGNYKSGGLSEDFNYQLIVSVEETLEMFGIIIFIHAILNYLIRINVKSFGVEINLNQDS